MPQSLKRKKTLLIAGARPNFMKIAPILRRMKEYPDRFEPLFVHTGQHYDDAMSKIFLQQLGLPEPDVFLGVGSASHAVQTARIMVEFEKTVEKEKPDLVVVVGDVNSTMACALVAAKFSIPVAHVEAGLRSRDRTMPEEINRIVTDRISDFLLTSCPDALPNLLAEGIEKKKIQFVGNVMIESLIAARPEIDASHVFKTLGLKKGQYALLTLHRPSNVDQKETLFPILEALARIQEEIPIIFPCHPRTRKMMAEFHVEHKGSKIENLRILDPLGYFDFIALERDAKLALTDSGGVQEETTFFKVPCITLRENTERPVTVTEGTNILVGMDPEKIVKESLKILSGKTKKGRIPKFWDGRVSARIVEALGAK